MRYLIIILCVLISSCSHQIKLDEALKLAKDNRQELEKVLKYYSIKKADSLKYKAACFLIENMPGHYSFNGNEIEQYYSEILPVLEKDVCIEEKYNQANSLYNEYIKSNNKYIQDIEIIKSDYLIWNIERAFKLWQEKKWLKYMVFEDFCEYILPYKVAELQSLDHWQDTLYLKYSYLLESIPKSQHDASIYIRAKSITDYLRSTVEEINTFYATGDSRQRSYNLLNASTIDKIPFGLCSDYVNLTVSILRSLGIPAFNDKFPFWNYIGFGHDWYSILNDNGAVISAFEFSNPLGSLFSPIHKYSKVFRKTYSHNPKVVKYLLEAKYIHPSIKLFQKDVTSNYIKTNKIDIPVKKKGLKDKYAYLTTFCGREWKIIDFAEIKKNKVSYNQIVGGAVYMVMGYNGTSRLVPVSKPFIVHKSGMIEYLNANSENKQDFRLYRKFPKKIHTARMENRILGGQIQASNHQNFSIYETFYVLGKFEVSDTIRLSSDKKYRYWRFYSKEYSFCNIAELQFYQKGRTEYASSMIIGEDKMFNNDPIFSPEKAFDGKWNTNYMAPQELEATNVWIGIDFSKPVIVDRVYCLPRSDDNGIFVGNEYELMYWGDNKWQSLGRKVAVERVISYESVPTNTIYWLRNHTRGVEEGVFTYEEDEQIWW